MITEKTPYPDWANPYQAVWTGVEWIVQFPGMSEARRGLLEMSIPAPMAPMPNLYAASDPNGNLWYVAVAK